MADKKSGESSSGPDRLYLLDGMALIYRAYFALIRTPIRTTEGFNTSAIFGFANSLIDLLQKYEPTHIAVAFDTREPTFRHVRYPEYKAQREEMPEDLSKSLEPVKRLIRGFNIPVLELPGYEADDIIGTIAKRADDAGGYETFMVTPDKDFAQLVSETTKIYKPGRQGSEAEILDLASIQENWQVQTADQVADILGLWGDASDNIPGVPGIGEKTAKKLIGQFGSIEEILANTNQLKGKQKENLENFGDQARLSKELATINVESPIELDFESLVMGEWDRKALQELLVEFEFNALGKRLFGDDFHAGRGHEEKKTIEDTPHEYRHIDAGDAKGRAALISKLQTLESFCFDSETSSLDPKTTKLLGLAFSWKPREGTYVEFPTGEGQATAVLEEFRPLFEKAGVEKVGHNLKFDLAVLDWSGLRAVGPFFDTMLAHALVEPDQRHQMDYMSEAYLGYTPVSITSLIGDKKGASVQLSMLDIVEEKSEEVAEYAAEDADITWQLAEIMRKELKEKDQERVFYDIEVPLLPILVDIEREGIAIDVEALATISEQLGKRIDGLAKEIEAAAGRPFNLKSPKQLGEVLFDELKLVDKPKKTKTGQYVTNEQVLQTLAHEHEIVRNILDYREATKLKSTYVDTLPEAVLPKSGRIHTSFHQLMTATGRLASSNPNLQNIPIRSAQGREIRRAFVPRDKDFVLLAADYSQIELRVMASLSNDKAMIEAFENGLDIHTATAARVYGVELDDVLPEMRRSAKMVNFGIIYGISAFGLSQRLGIARGEAGDIIENYLREYSGVADFMSNVVEDATERGYVETVSGRRRYLPALKDGNGTVRKAAERTAINTPIQGSAADMIKIAMVRVAAALDGRDFKSRMLLQVHDELVFDLHRDEIDIVTPLVVEAMTNAMTLKVPIVVETGLGENWLEAH